MDTRTASTEAVSRTVGRILLRDTLDNLSFPLKVENGPRTKYPGLVAQLDRGKVIISRLAVSTGIKKKKLISALAANGELTVNELWKISKALMRAAPTAPEPEREDKFRDLLEFGARRGEIQRGGDIP